MIDNLIVALDQCDTGEEIISILTCYEDSESVRIFRGIDKKYFPADRQKALSNIISKNADYLILIGESDSNYNESFCALLMGDRGYMTLKGEKGIKFLENMMKKALSQDMKFKNDFNDYYRG